MIASRLFARWRKHDGFVVVVMAAWLWPAPGAEGGILHGTLPVHICVALVFFLQGLSLSFTDLKAGVVRWPVHLMVLVCTFGFFPLLGLTIASLARPWLAPELVLGFVFLCALPSRVSPSVALTASAGGNVPVAVFNAALSSFAGVALTPLWMGGSGREVGGLMLGEGLAGSLVVWLLFPLLAGQLVRRWCANYVDRHSRAVHRVDRGTILLLVYSSLADSFARELWAGHGWRSVASTVFLCLLAMVAAGAWVGACGPAFRVAARRSNRSDVLRHDQGTRRRGCHWSIALRRSARSRPDLTADHALPPHAAHNWQPSSRPMAQSGLPDRIDGWGIGAGAESDGVRNIAATYIWGN